MRANGTVTRVATLGGNPMVTVGANPPIGVGGAQFDPLLRWRVNVAPPTQPTGVQPDQTVSFTDIDTGDVVATLPDQFPVAGWEFSPDGRSFAIADRSGHVFVYSAANAAGLSGSAVPGGNSGMPFVFGHAANQLQGADWAADGVQIVTGFTASTVLTGNAIASATVACMQANLSAAGGQQIFSLWPAEDFDQINKYADSIIKGSDEIKNRARILRDDLERQVDRVVRQIDELKELVHRAGGAE